MGISAVEALRYHTSLISLSNPSSLDFSIMKHPLCSKALSLSSFLGVPSAGSGGVGFLISVAFVVALIGAQKQPHDHELLLRWGLHRSRWNMGA